MAEAWPALHLGGGAGVYSWPNLPWEAWEPEAGFSSWVPCLWARPWGSGGGLTRLTKSIVLSPPAQLSATSVSDRYYSQ